MHAGWATYCGLIARFRQGVPDAYEVAYHGADLNWRIGWQRLRTACYALRNGQAMPRGTTWEEETRQGLALITKLYKGSVA